METYLKKIRVKKKSMEKTDIIICLKKKKQDYKNIKKVITRQKKVSI